MTPLPGYDAWKLASPPEYEEDAPECECDHADHRRCPCRCHRGGYDDAAAFDDARDRESDGGDRE